MQNALKHKKTIVKIGITTIVGITIIALIFVFYPRTLNINEYLDDGVSVIYTLSGVGSQFTVSLNSADDTMYVKILVDDKTVYEQNNIDSLNYNRNIGFGSHIIKLIVQNQRIFGSGDTIHISGRAVLDCTNII